MKFNTLHKTIILGLTLASTQYMEAFPGGALFSAIWNGASLQQMTGAIAGTVYSGVKGFQFSEITKASFEKHSDHLHVPRCLFIETICKTMCTSYVLDCLGACATQTVFPILPLYFGKTLFWYTIGSFVGNTMQSYCELSFHNNKLSRMHKMKHALQDSYANIGDVSVSMLTLATALIVYGSRAAKS